MTAVKYSFTESGETIINDYNNAKPFASFFPGVAGLYGIPMWAFYVNRGQCISSFGIETKDKSILEFFPANRSYQFTPILGFRTFLKVVKKGITTYYEPFRPSSDKHATEMIFNSSYLKLTEINNILGIKINVTYITVPNEKFPGLSRKVEVENISDEPVTIEMIDGLPWLNSYGTEIWVQKHMSRTGEAWVEVTNYEEKAPIYKLKVVIADRPEVEYFDCGHFSAYYDESGLLPAIIDPSVIFNQNTDLSLPENFIQSKEFQIPDFQTYENYTPCAMTYVNYKLNTMEKKSIYGIFGHTKDLKWVRDITKTIQKPMWFENKLVENEILLASIQNLFSTYSSSVTFDNYCKQTFLDNVLRGGLPVTISKSEKKSEVFHVYSRKHGDLERDYNHFSLQPSYLSQGNGNFRDINQNRRNDIWFNTDLNDLNIKIFYNLIQLDGHNPLVYKGSLFFISESSKLEKFIDDNIVLKNDRSAIKDLFVKEFALGDLLLNLEKNNIQLRLTKESFIENLLQIAERYENADFGEGYWSDHWTYNQDLLESYLAVYPDKAFNLFFEDKTFTYYQNYAWINPRSKRYIIRNGKPFQTNNVSEDHEKLKSKKIQETVVKTNYGKGNVYKTNLFSKLFCILINKISTLDPFGAGIELEGGKTNWNDSLNGLPGLFGSSTCETIEVKRLCIIMLKYLNKDKVKNISVPKELFKFYKKVENALKEASSDYEKTLFSYWDKTNSAKEEWRASVKYGIHGALKEISFSKLKKFLKLSIAKLTFGLNNSIDKNTGVLHSYFRNELLEHDIKEEKNSKIIIPKKFLQKPLAYFLEGPMHFLRISDKKEASFQYDAVKKSDLFDQKLKMFKVCASLKNMPKEIGRATVFSPGWLENESVFLHMEYKFLLETLRSGLVNEFFEDFKNALIPFQDPKRYGRSVLENVSFIVTSANTNEKLHGNGFVARLSGSTAEFVHMWLYMSLGKSPFKINDKNELSFTFAPILPKWLFSKNPKNIEINLNNKKESIKLPENHFAFVLLGKTFVIYENESLKNTYGVNNAKVVEIILTDINGKTETIKGDTLENNFALRLRDGKYNLIKVKLI